MTTLSLQFLKSLRDFQKIRGQENDATSLHPFSYLTLPISPKKLALSLTMQGHGYLRLIRYVIECTI